MHVTIEGNELIIRIPLRDTPKLSASGKTLVIATSGGNVKTDAQYEGKPITIGLNAYTSP